MLMRILKSRKARNLAIKALFFKQRIKSPKVTHDLRAYKNILKLSLPDCPLYLLLQRMNCLDFFKVKDGILTLNNQRYLLLRIPLLDSLKSKDHLIPPRFMQIAKQAIKLDINIVFDLSLEGICYEQLIGEDTAQELIEFNKTLIRNGFVAGRTYFLCADLKAQQYIQYFSEKYKINPVFKPLGYNFFLFYYYTHAKQSGVFDDVYKQKLIQCAQHTVDSGERRAKYFMCLNLKTRTHRTALVTALLQRNYLDKGIVTYTADEAAVSGKKYQLAPNALTYLSCMSEKEKIAESFDQLMHLQPMQYERDSNTIQQGFADRNKWIEIFIPEIKYYGSLCKIDSYFEIVTETYFTNEKCLYLTEKSLRPLFRFQFFILVGSPHSLKYLRNAGFQTFSPYIDESYDEIENEAERFAAILREIDKLCQLSKDELHQLYCQLWPRILHNFEHFSTAMPELFRKEIGELLAYLSP